MHLASALATLQGFSPGFHDGLNVVFASHHSGSTIDAIDFGHVRVVDELRLVGRRVVLLVEVVARHRVRDDAADARA